MNQHQKFLEDVITSLEEEADKEFPQSICNNVFHDAEQAVDTLLEIMNEIDQPRPDVTNTALSLVVGKDHESLGLDAFIKTNGDVMLETYPIIALDLTLLTTSTIIFSDWTSLVDSGLNEHAFYVYSRLTQRDDVKPDDDVIAQLREYAERRRNVINYCIGKLMNWRKRLLETKRGDTP